ncbi:hypothetical protein C8P66_10178 [Humitalea rosea]|uniref:Uncharacterized protein n=1 Tax=Humitalea rosea TaxID=990373 RepID=A0A2W7IXF3_9PROT|nr:hypothetical protein [Humitalea rosea]PZW50865.1 hypothetical protein C8P66_10178 [Humitalea rosea]
MTTLPALSFDESKRAKILLATKVAMMMGRKLEEGDWGNVYCAAKGIPDSGWSNLHIDVNYLGLGVEHKLLRCSQLNGRPIKSVCGTTLMHPAATRSIRIDNTSAPANLVMQDVFQQYSALIRTRTAAVLSKSQGNAPDMRVGWLLWEDNLTEFLYFEEAMTPPDPSLYYAEWNETGARGARKSSKSLWIFDKSTNQKRYSVTTSAGIKIQPYFDVPAPSDPNLYYFRVQSEPISPDTIQIWVAASTAQALKQQLGELTRENFSAAVLSLAQKSDHQITPINAEHDLAVPIPISVSAHAVLISMWEGAKSDEHRAQLLLKELS